MKKVNVTGFDAISTSKILTKNFKKQLSKTQQSFNLATNYDLKNRSKKFVAGNSNLLLRTIYAFSNKLAHVMSLPQSLTERYPNTIPLHVQSLFLLLSFNHKQKAGYQSEIYTALNK